MLSKCLLKNYVDNLILSPPTDVIFNVEIFYCFRQNNVIFLYPDLHHGIRGQFDNKGVLIAGHRGRVVAEKSSMPEGIKEILFEEEDGKMLKSDIATKTHLSSTPLTRDPYESTMVDVKKSNIKNAGQGVFLKSESKFNQYTG